MRAPPPLTVDIPPARGWQALQAGLFALAGAALAAWGSGHLGLERTLGVETRASFMVGVLIATVAAMSGALGWWLARSQPVRLSWTGERWVLASPPTGPFEPVHPEVAFDLGGALLLRLEAEGGAVKWVAATRSQLVGDWVALRATLHHGVRDSAPPAAP